MADRPNKKSKRPSDVNQRAKSVVDEATGQADPGSTEEVKNPAAVALGRLGGLKGGKSRADKLSKKRRREIAAKAAQARWNKHRNEKND